MFGFIKKKISNLFSKKIDEITEEDKEEKIDEIKKDNIKLEENTKEKSNELDKEFKETQVKRINEDREKNKEIIHEKLKQKKDIHENTKEEQYSDKKENKESEKKQESINNESINDNVINDNTINNKKKNIFSRITEKITSKKLTEELFNKIFDDIELDLLQNNVSLEVVDYLRDFLKEKLVGLTLNRNKIKQEINNTLQEALFNLLNYNVNFVDEVKNKIKEKKPIVIMFIGVNGSGKTTTIAKLIKKLKDNNLSVVVAASDTFRAAAIDQLQDHCNNLNVRLIKQQYNSDPAAVAFDALKHAKSKGIDVLLIDTAGRQHTNKDLIEELKKIKRVVNPDYTIFVGESIAGNDCINQARIFNNEIGIDYIILTKADIDNKGGTFISIGYVLKKPIIYVGKGQEYNDLIDFDVNNILESI